MAGNKHPRTAHLRQSQWKPGQSGNPSGRPRQDKDVTAIARENAEKAIKRLVRLVDSADERVALAASQAVLDRALGKPKQPIDATPRRPAPDVHSLSDAELLAIINEGRKGSDDAPEAEA